MLALGYDGKDRAHRAACGEALSSLGTLYVGLLQAAPATMEGMDLATLVSAGQGNEFAIASTFYASPGRLALTLGALTVDADGAVRLNDAPTLAWTNTTGSAVTVAALFITDAASGTTGKVLWVGTPDAGTASIPNGLAAQLTAGDLTLKID